MKNAFSKLSSFPCFYTIVSSVFILGSNFLPLTPAAAQSFTANQRNEIISIVRQAMKKDPTILEDAITAAQKARDVKRQDSASKILSMKKGFLQQLQPTDGMIGNPLGKKTITEFYDPRCPYCKKMLPELFQLIKENHDVKVIFKIVPILGEDSVLEARAITASTRQNKYIQMMRVLMASNESPSIASIKNLAKQQGMNETQLEQDMKSASITQALEDNIELLHDLEIDGTPALIINGSKIIPGAIRYEDIKKLLEDNSTK